MNVAELIEEINRQLDVSPESFVTFSRDNAFSLLSRLTLLKNLIDKKEDKTSQQIAALMVQRATAAERRVDQLTAVLKQLSDPLALHVEGNEVGIARALRVIYTVGDIAKAALPKEERPKEDKDDQSTALGG